MLGPNPVAEGNTASSQYDIRVVKFSKKAGKRSAFMPPTLSLVASPAGGERALRLEDAGDRPQ